MVELTSGGDERWDGEWVQVTSDLDTQSVSTVVCRLILNQLCRYSNRDSVDDHAS